MGQYVHIGVRSIHATAFARQKLGLIYASQGGTTEDVAEMISKMIDIPKLDIDDVKDVQDFTQYDALIIGAPTHNTLADKYRSDTGWDDIIDEVREIDLTGKKVAVFGLGDSNCYPEGFCDAMEELHNVFQSAGASMLGYVDSSGYEHSESKSDIDGKFIGLPLDEMNEDDLTKDRLKAWISQLKEEGMPL